MTVSTSENRWIQDPLRMSRDDVAFDAAIGDASGPTILHLQAGTERNAAMVDTLMSRMNASAAVDG